MAAKLPAGITGHSGALYQSVPTICGGAVVGSIPTQTCYQYSKDGASGIMQWTNNVSKPLVTYTFLIIRFSILHFLVFLLLFEVKFLTILTIHFNFKMLDFLIHCKWIYTHQVLHSRGDSWPYPQTLD